MSEFANDKVLKSIRKNKDLSKSSRRKKILEHLHEKYGYMLDLPPNCLPKEHKANLGGGLRCFSMAWKRDKFTGNKVRVNGKFKRVRCNNPAVKGSFHCKKHGGGNSYALTNGKNRNPILAMYRNPNDVKFFDLMEAYLQDETVMDIKPELASLRVALQKYLDKLIHTDATDMQSFMKKVERITENDLLTQSEKYVALLAEFNKVETITNGQCLDRLARLVDTVSRVIERMQKAANQEQYILTQDGLKTFLRAVVDIVNSTVDDTETRAKFKNALMEINMNTKGNIGSYRGYKVEDAEFTVEDA